MSARSAFTSFMQEVTRVRALEGEIGRSIQQISGVSAARVHIVMPDVATSVVPPEADGLCHDPCHCGSRPPRSLLHSSSVASAVPGLDVDDVTILDSTGQLLASGDENGNSTMTRSLNIVQNVQKENRNQYRQGVGAVPGYG